MPTVAEETMQRQRIGDNIYFTFRNPLHIFVPVPSRGPGCTSSDTLYLTKGFIFFFLSYLFPEPNDPYQRLYFFFQSQINVYLISVTKQEVAFFPCLSSRFSLQ